MLPAFWDCPLANVAGVVTSGGPGGASPTAALTAQLRHQHGTTAQVTCPIIPFSQRGGASTDPNDGSLWLYGEFAKNRLSTIPGPGQWGTSVANYALSFPAVDRLRQRQHLLPGRAADGLPQQQLLHLDSARQEPRSGGSFGYRSLHHQ